MLDNSSFIKNLNVIIEKATLPLIIAVLLIILFVRMPAEMFVLVYEDLKYLFKNSQTVCIFGWVIAFISVFGSILGIAIHRRSCKKEIDRLAAERNRWQEIVNSNFTSTQND